MGLAAEDGGDVGEDGEHRPGADDGEGQCAQHRAPAEYADFGHHTDAWRCLEVGQGEPQCGHGHHAEASDAPEGGAPAEQFAKPGGQRHTANSREGEAHKHGRHCTGTFFRGDYAGGDDGADAKEGAVVE